MRFRKGEIVAWIETQREDIPQVKRTKYGKRNIPDVDKIVRRVMDASKSTGYNSSGKSDHSIKGLGKE